MDDRQRIARAVIESEYGPGTWDDAIRWGHDDIVRKGHREADAVLAALGDRLLPELPEWVTYMKALHINHPKYETSVLLADSALDDANQFLEGDGPTIADAIRDAMGEAEADDAQ